MTIFSQRFPSSLGHKKSVGLTLLQEMRQKSYNKTTKERLSVDGIDD